MKKSICMIPLVILLALSVSATVSAKLKFDPVSDYDWNVSEDPEKNITDAVIIFEKAFADETGMAEGEYLLTIYRRIRILSDKGRAWADVTVPYYYEKQVTTDVRARTIVRGQEVVKLKKEHIFKKEVAKSKGLKIKLTSFSAPGVTDDCIVEYIYTLKLPRPMYFWQAQNEIALLRGELLWSFFRGKGTSSEDYREFTRKFAPNYLWLYTSSKVGVQQLPSEKKVRELLFTIDSVPPLKEEPVTLPERTRRAQVLCYYGAPDATGDYWKEEAEETEEKNKKFCKKRKELIKALDSFGKLASYDEIIKATYDWVQENITNISYYKIVDEHDKKIKLKKRKNIDDVIKRGYGNSNQITLVFCEALRQLGLDAKTAYVVDRDESLVVYDAKYWQFDRAIAAVNNGLNYDYYAPGLANSTLGQVGWFNEGVSAFIAGTEELFYEVLPSTAKSNRISRSVQVTLGDDLRFTGTVKERRTGHIGRPIRNAFLKETEIEQQEILDDLMHDNFPGAEIDSVTVTNQDNLSKPVSVSCKLEFEDAIQPMAGRLLIKPMDYLGHTSNPFESDKRHLPIVFNYAYETSEALTIDIPEKWIVEALPSDTMFKNDVGMCAVKFVKFGSKLTAQRLFTLNDPFWSPERYPEIRNLFQAREVLNGLTVVLKEE